MGERVRGERSTERDRARWGTATQRGHARCRDRFHRFLLRRPWSIHPIMIPPPPPRLLTLRWIPRSVYFSRYARVRTNRAETSTRPMSSVTSNILGIIARGLLPSPFSTTARRAKMEFLSFFFLLFLSSLCFAPFSPRVPESRLVQSRWTPGRIRDLVSPLINGVPAANDDEKRQTCFIEYL